MKVFKYSGGDTGMVIHMNRKVVVILLLAALIIGTGAVLARPGEDSDAMGTTGPRWDIPLGKEGGDEGVFLGFRPAGEDSDI